MPRRFVVKRCCLWRGYVRGKQRAELKMTAPILSIADGVCAEHWCVVALALVGSVRVCRHVAPLRHMVC